MLQRIIEQPWAFLAFVLVIVLLQIGAALRLRHDRRLRQRALVDRRQTPRPSRERRWDARPHQK